MIVTELAARFGLQVDEAAFSKIETAMRGLSNGLVGFGAAIAGAVVGLTGIVAKTANAGDAASATAEKLDMTTQALQGLQYAAELSDGTADGLANGLKYLGRNAAEAAQGGDEMQKAFARAGVSLRGTDGAIRPTDQLLASLADKFQAMGEGHGPEKLSLAMKLLGRSGAELVPMLNKGSKGIAELRAEAERLGVVMSNDTVKASEQWDDSTKRLSFAFVGLRNAIGGPLIRQFTDYVKAISKFVAKNKEAIAAPIIKFAKALGSTIKFLAGETKAATFVWFGLATLLATKVVTALMGAKVGFDLLSLASMKAAGSAMRAWLTATGPIVLLAAAIALIVDDLYGFAKGDDSVLGRIVDWTSKIDPDDNNMIKALKKIGAALFDIQKAGAMKGLVTGMLEAGAEIEAGFKRLLKFDWIGEAIVKAIFSAFNAEGVWDKLNGGVKMSTDSRVPFTQRLVDAFSPPTLRNNPGGMVTSPMIPEGGGGGLASTNSNNSVTIHAPVTINTNVSAREIRKEIEGHHRTTMEQAVSAVEGG